MKQNEKEDSLFPSLTFERFISKGCIFVYFLLYFMKMVHPYEDILAGFKKQK